ncbi:MAG: TIM-barrel domain-containing protein [Victivallales bacterium]|jgi:hypothetical protein
MNLKRNGADFTAEGKNWKLSWRKSQPMRIRLSFANEIGADLLVYSGCDRDEMIDELISMELPSIKESAKAINVVFEGRTTLWEKAEYMFTCTDERVIYGYKVHGTGNLDNARFFEGFMQEKPQLKNTYLPTYCGWSRESSWHRPEKYFMESSSPHFYFVQSSQLSSSDTRHYPFYESTAIRVNGDRFYMGGDWLVSPPPFFYTLENRSKDNCVGMGLLAKPGENTFVEFQYKGGEGFGLNLTYEGYTRADGKWESPSILFEMAGDYYGSLKNYVGYMRSKPLLKKGDHGCVPRWWKEPIFGGWGEQVFLSDHWKDYRNNKSKGWSGSSLNHCTRKAYEKMLSQLEDKGVNPTILIVDNRWFRTDNQLTVDEKLWPDMKEFNKQQHAKGRKVILWVSPFNYNRYASGDDVPTAEHLVLNERKCFDLSIDTDVFYPDVKRDRKKTRVPSEYAKLEWAKKLHGDAFNPDYEKRLREKVRHLLSPKGLDADGFEFDYTHFLPTQRGFLPANGRASTPWGIEFLHKMLWIFYDEAKKTKPDALIIAQTFNPYFDDIVDMLRLNDIYTDRLSVVDQMDHRAKIAHIVCPGCMVHTDQHPMPSLKSWREYMRYQPKIGNPCLYYATGIETTGELFEERDWQMLREVWGAYQAGLDRQYPKGR